MSGYTYCACRDCMDTAITSDSKPALCLLCKGAGCEIHYGSGEGGTDCQREDAYEGASQFCPYSNLQAQQNMGAIVSNGADLGAYDTDD